MTRRFNKRVSPELVAAKRKLRAAESAYRRALRSVQSGCKHEVVFFTPYQSGEFFGPFHARRLCAACGYEEELRWGSKDSWSGTVSDCTGNTKPGSRAILNTDLIIEVTRDKLYAMRQPSG